MGARASCAHELATRRAAEPVGWFTIPFGAQAAEAIGETPMAATGTVAFPVSFESSAFGERGRLAELSCFKTQCRAFFMKKSRWFQQRRQKDENAFSLRNPHVYFA